jgi:hypothetical protein
VCQKLIFYSNNQKREGDGDFGGFDVILLISMKKSDFSVLLVPPLLIFLDLHSQLTTKVRELFPDCSSIPTVRARIFLALLFSVCRSFIACVRGFFSGSHR